MKKIIFISLSYWVLVCYLLLLLKSGKPTNRYYYHGKVNSTYEWIVDLNKQKDSNGLFEWCCDGLQFYGEKLGYTYEEMNFFVFVILNPSIIIYLIILIIFIKKQ